MQTTLTRRTQTQTQTQVSTFTRQTQTQVSYDTQVWWKCFSKMVGQNVAFAATSPASCFPNTDCLRDEKFVSRGRREELGAFVLGQSFDEYIVKDMFTTWFVGHNLRQWVLFHVFEHKSIF